jgi:anti-sigma regulatory factor (Ser/Thr protein kinase)
VPQLLAGYFHRARPYPDHVAPRVASKPVPDGDVWVRSALARLGQLPRVHRVGLALAEGGGRRLLFAASDRNNEPSVDWCEVDAYEDVPLNHSVRTGKAVVGSMAHLAGQYRAFADRQGSQTYAFASLPLLAAGHIHGGFALFYDTPQRFDRAQVRGLQDLGSRLGDELRRVQRATTNDTRSLDDEPIPEGARVATFSATPDPQAVALARQFVRSTLAGWGVDDQSVGNAILCLSELVTNAIMHTDVGCDVRLVLERGVLTTTVRDGGSSVVVDPSSVAMDPLAVHGRGLQIVDALSTRWGSKLDAVGMTVWFVLEPADRLLAHPPVV